MIAEQRKQNWLFEPVDSAILQMPRALAASIVAALVDCAILAFLKEIIGWNALFAAAGGYLAGGVLQYVLCSLWVFGPANTPNNQALGFLAFTLLSLVGLGITELVMALGSAFSLTYSAKLVALGATFFWNFLSRKYLMFKPATRSHMQPSDSEPAIDINPNADYDAADLHSSDKHEALARWLAQMVKGAPAWLPRKRASLRGK